YFGLGNAQFGPPTHLHTAGTELRGIALADFTGDGLRDIAVGAPYDGKVFLFVNQGGGTFMLTNLPAWRGARDLAAGDFDGDGLIDLVVAGTTNGVAHYHNLGGGVFELKTNIVSIGTSNDNDFPQPAYYLKAFRPLGASRDEIAVARAQRNKLNVLAIDADGRLAVQGTLTNISVNALDVGPLLHPAASAVPDLVVSHNSRGVLEIHSSVSTIARFSQITNQQIDIPGGPRNVRIVDLDGDGWNDLVVVQQSFNKVLTFRNLNGFFVPTAEAAVGAQPREMDWGDFNDDGHPDVAVLNRDSADVSILVTYPGSVGFSVPDSVYPVDGEVSGLEVRDFNGDGRADVIQVHRASGEMSVRLAGTNGVLGEPSFYAIGTRPIGKVVVDVNHDGIPDIITADMTPFITVRLGLGDGHLGPSIISALPDPVPTTSPVGMIFPSAQNSSLFSVEAADFDGDGQVDVAVGFWDCRVGFFRGHGDGTFTFTQAHALFSEPRALRAGDFDADGDLDLVCASLYGNIAVLENGGDMMTTTNLPRRIYESGIHDPREIQVYDANHDNDLDLLVVGAGGTALFLGGPGLEFNPGTSVSGQAVSSVTTADFNGDGQTDIASSCAGIACVSILLGDASGQYTPFLTAPVPSARFLATGDIDGDGLPDLVGSGEALWVALSGHRAVTNPPSLLSAARAVADHPVINEVLASNSSLPLDADGSRFSDWIEVFNGASNNVSFTGWRLLLIRTNVTGVAVTNQFGFTNQFTPTNWVVVTNQYFFPTNATIPPGGHQLVICTDKVRTPFHAGFTLPSAGGTLCLFNAQNVEVDRVDYPPQQSNISHSRFRDGMTSFMSCNFPTPGAANTDSGPVPPTLDFDGVDLSSIGPDQPIRFFARSTDDVGVMGVVVMWKRLDLPNSPTNRLVLDDDGMSGDGAMLDGVFSGVLPGLPAGAEIQFYLQAMDVSEIVVTAPGNPVFAAAGQPVTGYSLAIGAPRPPLEISEVLGDNRGGLHDEGNGTPDWIEIRNCSTNPVSLAGVSLGQKFFGTDGRMSFTNTTLAPGEHFVIYADDAAAQGPLHAPFKLNKDGDQLVLTGLAPDGSRMLIDSVSFGPQTANVSWSRLGCGGPWRTSLPTPRAGNLSSSWASLVRSNTFLFAYPTTNGFKYTVEFTDDVAARAWSALPAVNGNGLEQTITQPLEPRRFFRVKRE
ncbi:MAG TPA: FG-GAP-like repeat-containing protein, partial [Verrucomicrobiae bacterium]